MKACQAFSYAVLAAALAVFAGPAAAQASDAALLHPGEPYSGAEQSRVKLIPPEEVKKREAAKAAKTAPPAQTATQSPAPPSGTAAYAPPQFDPGIPSAVTTVQDTVIVSPAQTRPATPASASNENAAANRVPLALTPSSPDIIIGLHGEPQNEAFVPPRNPISSGTRRKSRPSAAAAIARPGTGQAAAPAQSAPEPIAASLAPVPRAPSADTLRGLSKRSEIVFPEGAVDPSPDTVTDLRRLAAELTAALRGTARVQLEAFGGQPGDKSSDARRLSLKRALAVRALLIESGVPAERIDVRALGGITDGGMPDRVDVFVRSG
ncbi:MAG: OmpA family protein [Alphaproteobacteria bacterium]